MNFIETRGNDATHPLSVTFSEAILSPIASYGGLYVPQTLPQLGEDFLKKHISSSYKELALDMLSTFEIDIEHDVLEEAVALYDRFDDPSNPVPVVKVKKNLYVSELYHGPTRAFKDMALQPFGKILSSVAQEKAENYLILAATSGDTGPAALETFKNQKNIQVVCLYPANGTSDVQRLQMVTEDASNLKVIGIKGNFDDAQSALKYLLASQSFKAALKEKNISLSAANSVNFGRIIFQIVYHIHNYLELVRQGAITIGEKIYLNVPSGNFGNVLGGFYAQNMGLPVEKLVISSNENNILTRLIQTGVYDIREGDLKLTTSPAMDILKSSNVERVLFSLYGAQRTRELMADLDAHNIYTLSEDELKKLQEVFVADYCSDSEGKEYIKSAFNDGYLMDPHTATCFKTFDTKSDPKIKSVIYSTAEWTKFSPVIANALTGEENAVDSVALEAISKEAKVEIPAMIKGLFDKRIIHDSVIEKEDIEREILKFL
ncbi:threonine synthase [Sulfurimonas sp. SAG-AH-194-I05]|nr:threonine synthase [Sulfurimonas sp. SAG-AH-194-I05]MDF1875422.1 threonine synthase [Sulfurimonas sp. SAG-AH-194-I05]